MEDGQRGWRAIPAPLLIALASSLTFIVARAVVRMGWPPERGFSLRVILVSEGIAFATHVLLIVGLAELAGRLAGTAAKGVRLAFVAVTFVFAADVLLGFVQFTKDPWEHRKLWEIYDYLAPLAWLGVPAGLTLALPPSRRALGGVTVVILFLTWPLPVMREPLYGWMGSGKTQVAIDAGLRLVRYGSLLALVAAVATGVTSIDRQRAARGYRLAAKALWLRVVAAMFVVLVTLMMIGSRGSGGVGFFKLALMSQGIVGVIALVMCGMGALGGARSAVAGLSGYTLAIGGGAVSWAAGVTLAQLPQLYRMLYGDHMSSSDAREYADILSLAMPVVVILGVGLLATALSGYAARRGDEDLRAHAQGKGIGFVVLMLVAISIQSWMMPKAASVGSFVALALLSAGASLGATVMMAKLFGRGAEAIEAEPGLPPASVVATDG